MQLTALLACVGSTIGIVAAAATPTDAKAPTRTLRIAERIVRATDEASIVAVHDPSTIGGKPIYASYSDRESRVAATFLDGKLAQCPVETTLYAADVKCFNHRRLPNFVGLSRIATTLLPLQSTKQMVRYTV